MAFTSCTRSLIATTKQKIIIQNFEKIDHLNHTMLYLLIRDYAEFVVFLTFISIFIAESLLFKIWQ